MENHFIFIPDLEEDRVTSLLREAEEFNEYMFNQVDGLNDDEIIEFHARLTKYHKKTIDEIMQQHFTIC